MGIDIYDGDPCSMFKEKVHRAIEAIKCSCCGIGIRVGDYYHRTMFISEARWFTIRRCAPCQKIYEHLLKKRNESKAWDMAIDLWLDCGEEYEDEWGEPPPPEIAALAFALPNEINLKDSP